MREMKIAAKPMSSPSRTEKFPPPLMRFLRSNTGSRSRGRSRSSPMFVRKKNVVIETQEPSSPKATCMGQVRVRRSSKKSLSKSGSHRRRTPARKPFSCWWVRKTLSCRPFLRKLRPKSFPSFWTNCFSFFSFRCCKTPQKKKESSKLGTETNCNWTETEHGDENLEEEDEAEPKLESLASSSPPKNALLLTRCRSAPYRSSSLASRFWGSPLVPSSETGDEDENENGESKSTQPQPLQDRLVLESRATSENEPSCRDSTSEPQTDQESVANGSISGGCLEEDEELGTGERGSSRRALILTRCKSAPARRGERLDPESSFWRERRRPLQVCD